MENTNVKNTIKGIAVCFADSTDVEGKKVIIISQNVEDEITGITIPTTYSYVVVPTIYFKAFIGKEVELTLVNSEKLATSLGKAKYNVVTQIKLVK